MLRHTQFLGLGKTLCEEKLSKIALPNNNWTPNPLRDVFTEKGAVNILALPKLASPLYFGTIVDFTTKKFRKCDSQPPFKSR